MPDLFIYLLKANVALCLFYLAYRLGLRRLTFYTLNRVFLVTGILFSSAFPLVDVNDFFNRNEKALESVVYYVPDINALKAVQAEDPFTVWNMLAYAFWAGVAVMGLRLLFQLLSLGLFHLRSRPAHVQDTHVRVVQREMSPFSFFKNIYINPSMHTHEELDAVIQHESIHVKEWHSADVMMGEVNNVFYWFNPGAWLMKTAIRENLEFITDRRMLRAGVDPKVYQYSLLKVSGAPYATAIANNFNFSHLKNRIMMMNKERSSRYQVVRYAILGCMVSMLVLTLNFSRAGVKLSPVGEGTIPQLIVDRLEGETKDTTPVVENIAKDTTVPFAAPVRFKMSIDSLVANTSSFQFDAVDTFTTDGKKQTLKFVAVSRVVVPANGKRDTVYGDVTFVTNTPVAGGQIAKFQGRPVDEVTVIGYGTKGENLKVTNGKPLEAVTVAGMPLTGRVAGLSTTAATDEVMVTGTGNIKSVTAKTLQGVNVQGEPFTLGQSVRLRGAAIDGAEPDYYVNGKKVALVDIQTIDPAKIESVSVLKDGGTSLNGKIMIVTKDSKTPALTFTTVNGVATVTDEKAGVTMNAKNIQLRFDSTRIAGQNPVFRVKTDGKPNLLYVVNGKVDSTALLHLDGSQIKSISVLKDDAARAIYGRPDVDGVMLVETRDSKRDKLEEVTVVGRPSNKSNNKLEEVIVTGYAFPRQPAAGDKKLEEVTIVGKSAAKPEALTIKPATLEGFSVFPNPSEGIFNVTFNAGKANRFELAAYNMAGEMKYQYKGSANGVFKGKVDLSSYPAGSYIISVVVDGIKHSKTVIKK